MKFKIAYKKGNKYLLKIVLDEGEEVWATTTEAVYNFAKKNFEKDEEAGFDYTEKNGQYFVKRITKNGKSSKSGDEPENTCEDCGKPLKDDKYTKCYTCNNKKRKSSKSSGGTYSKSPEDKEQIKRLSILSSVSHAIMVLQGHIDNVDTLGDIIDALYDKFYQKLSE